MSRRLIALSLLSAAAVLAVALPFARNGKVSPRTRERVPKELLVRQVLFKEIQPVALANCELERFGEQYDGGYLLCRNLLGEVQSSYSYGISGYDQWGCDVSTRLKIPVHEYDCFNLKRPACATGTAVFHPECIANRSYEEDGRPFDTLANQSRKNGDQGKRLVVKMDVEGAEWDSFMDMPDELLRSIDQMAVEFHGVNGERRLEVIWKLKQFFHVASLHWNNFACDTGEEPMPASVFELLLVNKRIATLAPDRPVTPSFLHRPNNPGWRDCQTWTAK